jgi:ribosomal protein S18 acetylase RimI-like enzyme
VDPVNRHMGCGSRMLDEVIEHYKSNTGIALTCKTSNVPAQILYLVKGFRPVRVMPRYYAQEGDGVLMRRII